MISITICLIVLPTPYPPPPRHEPSPAHLDTPLVHRLLVHAARSPCGCRLVVVHLSAGMGDIAILNL